MRRRGAGLGWALPPWVAADSRTEFAGSNRRRSTGYHRRAGGFLAARDAQGSLRVGLGKRRPQRHLTMRTENHATSPGLGGGLDTRTHPATGRVNGDTGGPMLHRLMLGGAL